MRTFSLRAWVVWIAWSSVLLLGCIEDASTADPVVAPPEPPPESPMYGGCETAPACPGLVECITPEGAIECVATECDAATCDCLADQICGSRLCVEVDAGFRCVAPSEPPMGERSVTALTVANACFVPQDDNRIELRLTLGDEGGASITDLADPPMSFAAVEGRAFMGSEPIEIQAEADGAISGLEAAVESIEFVARPRPDDQLIVFALDNSGSLIGENAGGVDISTGTDLRDERIVFFRTLLTLLAPEAYVSIVSFQGQLPVFDPDYAVPTRNRDISAEGITQLERGATGPTPLARTLADLRPTLFDANDDLDPVLVLFTDGIEAGDPGDDAERSDLRAQIMAYAAAEIPVVVLQLQPPPASGHPRGRDPRLVELACASGGAHFFIEEPAEFTDARSDLATQVRRVLDGSWRLRAQVDLSALAPGGHFLSTTLTMQTDGDPVRQVLTQSPERVFDDTRLWIQR
jgi:Mg-chelatase subunit ChlD